MKKLVLILGICLTCSALVSATDRNGNSAVGRVVTKEIIRQEQEAKKAKREKNNAALEAAIQNDTASVQRILLDGASINAFNPVDRKTLLIVAIENNNLGLAKSLVNGKATNGKLFMSKASKCWKDKEGKTPLMYAAEQGSRLIGQIVFEEKCKEDRDYMGRTALMYAAENGHREFVRWLVHEKKVSTLPEDTRHQKASDYARKANFPELANDLVYYEQLEAAHGLDNITYAP